MPFNHSEEQEIKKFLEENLSQEIDTRLIYAIQWHEVLSKFFYNNLYEFITPDTSELVRNWVNSLKNKEKKKFKITPFLFGTFN